MTTITREEALAVTDLKAGYTLGHADVAILQRPARIALAAQAAGPVYQWRERYEEGDLWDDCTKEQYEGFANRPDVETRILYTAPPAPTANPSLKAMMQALDAFYAEEVPERGMLFALRILLDDYRARTQHEARNDR